MRKTIAILLVATFLFFLISCSNEKNDEDATEYDLIWIVGKTKYEIIERYGEFDSSGNDKNYNIEGYSYGRYEGKIPISGGKKRYTDSLTIRFDENGVAYRAEKERIDLTDKD